MTFRLERWLRDVWRGDPNASDIAMQVEHRLARMRFVVIAAATVLGVALAVVEQHNGDYRQAIPINLACLALATAVLLATRRGQRPTWLAVVTSVGDVTLVTLLHVLDLVHRNPSVAVNGRITFTGYFLALLGTCVRWDRRIAIGTGVVAAAQYAGIVTVAARMWPGTATADIIQFGQFDIGVQIERVVTLVLFGVGCGMIAHWAVRLREFATTDQLTGLLNRRTFEERIRDELLKARRQATSLSLVMVDLDHFKHINDQYGHRAGDQVLREVAATLRHTVRRTDLVSRWGGEEFALAYLDSSPDEAARSAELLRRAVESADIRLENGVAVTVTLSAGVATARSDGFEFDAVLGAADERLLAAKQGGRNRVVSGDRDPIR